MATSDELLAAAMETADDKTLVIDTDLRQIIIPPSITHLGVESDSEVLRLRFKMPLRYDGIKLSEYQIRINYLNANGGGDVYEVDDNEVEDDTITFSWLIGRFATAYKGNVTFNVCLKRPNDDGTKVKEFNTTIATLPVLEGLETGDAVVHQNPDALEQLRNELFSGTPAFVTPETYGAVGDGVTDDSAAFTNAILSGKKVVCDGSKIYYFAKPIDVRTLISGHLDGGNARFLNFHIYVNINDDFNDWRHAYSVGKFVVENMRFEPQNSWTTLPIGWETPLITTGAPMIIRNIITSYPFVLATTDSYIDTMRCENWSTLYNYELWEGIEWNLDIISCLNKNGEYCRFDRDTTPSAAGDAWLLSQCHGGNRPGSEWKTMRVTKRQPFNVKECISAGFVIDAYSKVIFDGCHWEDNTVTVEFKSSYQCNTTFINCYFYDNYVLNNDKNTVYKNCFFRASNDAVIGGYTLAHMTGNTPFYDLKCVLENCNFGGSHWVDTMKMKRNKAAPKKTYLSAAVYGYRTKLESITLSVNDSNLPGHFFTESGEYTYDIYLLATSRHNIAVDHTTLKANIESVKKYVKFSSIGHAGGGLSMVVVRTSPSGVTEVAAFYPNPSEVENPNAYLINTLADGGAYAVCELYGAYSWNVLSPWVVVSEKPSFTINDALYEANGVLVTLDNSDAGAVYDGCIQVSTRLPEKVTVDTALSELSTNPVQNKVVHEKFTKLESDAEKRNEYVTPQMYGAVADGTTDDAAAIQAAIDSGKTVRFPYGKYCIANTINIAKKSKWNLFAESAEFVYTGTEYAFELSACRNTNLHFGKITASTGGCLAFVSTSWGDFSQRVNVDFIEFIAGTNCVHAIQNGGEVSNVTIRDGRMNSGLYCVCAEANSGQVSNWHIDNIIFDKAGMAHINVSEITDWEINGCKKLDKTKLVKTTGTAKRVRYTGTQPVTAADFDVSPGTSDWRIQAPITTVGGEYKATDAYISAGYLLPHVNDRNGGYRHCGGISELDLRTIEDPVNDIFTMFTSGQALTKLYLSRKYGVKYGINRFVFAFEKNSGEALTIYDADGNIIFNNTADVGWSTLEFLWTPQFGWIVQKLNKIKLTV